MSLKRKVFKMTQKYVDKFKFCYVFQHQNMKNVTFREVAENDWADSKFQMGKKKVIGIALGRTEETSYKLNTWKISEQLKGQRALLFTDKKIGETVDYFNKFEKQEYAHSGDIAPVTLVFTEQSNVFDKCSYSIEPYLRQLGVDTKLVNGKIKINNPYLACTHGQKLTAE